MVEARKVVAFLAGTVLKNWVWVGSEMEFDADAVSPPFLWVYGGEGGRCFVVEDEE